MFKVTVVEVDDWKPSLFSKKRSGWHWYVELQHFTDRYNDLGEAYNSTPRSSGYTGTKQEAEARAQEFCDRAYARYKKSKDYADSVKDGTTVYDPRKEN